MFETIKESSISSFRNSRFILQKANINLESSRLEFHAKKISPIVAFLRVSVTF